VLPRLAMAFLVSLVLATPHHAAAQERPFTELVDLPTAHSMQRGEYALTARVAPNGGLIARMRVGIVPYLMAGVSYGAGNVVGTGAPEWNDRVEFDVRLRLAEETGALPALAAGYDSRGYGRQTDEGEYEKSSTGFYIVAAKTMPFSEYWHLHFGVSRTLDAEKARPDLLVGASARFSQEFSVLAEYQVGLNREKSGAENSTGYLNVGLRWIFSGRVQIDLYFRNLVGPSGSPERSSRSIGFAYYDSF